MKINSCLCVCDVKLCEFNRQQVETKCVTFYSKIEPLKTCFCFLVQKNDQYLLNKILFLCVSCHGVACKSTKIVSIFDHESVMSFSDISNETKILINQRLFANMLFFLCKYFGRLNVSQKRMIQVCMIFVCEAFEGKIFLK